MSRKTFHVALYVQDVEAAVARYRRLLGQEPAKVRHDYAKFEIADPPVILSLNLGGPPGTLSHLGIRHPGTGDVACELVRARQAELDRPAPRDTRRRSQSSGRKSGSRICSGVHEHFAGNRCGKTPVWRAARRTAVA
jgi:catechol 2,3-dioxygenase-like lactoylglutathione lyase family enzyme